MIMKWPEVYELAIASGIMWIIAGLAMSEVFWRALLFFTGFVILVYGIIKIPNLKRKK